MTRATAHTRPVTHDAQSVAAGASAALTRALARVCLAAPALRGALLRPSGDGSLTVIAASGGAGGDDASWLADPAVAAIARETLATRREVVERGADPPARTLVAMPIFAPADGVAGHAPAQTGAVRAAAVFLLDAAIDADSADRVARLRLCPDLIRAAEAAHTLEHARAAVDRAHAALSILCAVNEHVRFFAAAVRLCNELGARFACSRVSFGETSGDGARLLAVSHTERIARSAALARAIEAAMDECADQAEPVRFPPAPDDESISRDVGALTRQHGARAAMCVPVNGRDGAIAVIALEREHDAPFSDDEADTIGVIAALCGARLVELRAHDRWFGVRLVRDARAALAWAVGSRHTWTKVGALAAAAFLAFAVFTTMPDRVGASMIVQPVARHDVAAPFAGRVERTLVGVGDRVEAGRTALCELDTTDLRLELAEARADLAARETEAAAHMRDGRAAEASIAQASGRRVEARIALLEERVGRAIIIAAIDGVVVSSALERRAQAPVAAGDTLFEIASTSMLFAELHVPDAHISRVRVGMRGELAAASRPGERIGFVIERIDPDSRVVDGRNVYRAIAGIDGSPAWLRPGLTGEAKIDAGRARRIERWTRPIVDWTRLRLWL